MRRTLAMASTLRRASTAEATAWAMLWSVDLHNGERLALGNTLRAGGAGRIAARAGGRAAEGEVGDVQAECSPRMVPMRPITPGTSWLRMATRVPWRGASMSMPSSVSRRGEVPWSTVADALASPSEEWRVSLSTEPAPPETNSFLSSWMRMPRSAAMAAALMRLATGVDPGESSEPAKMPAMAALRMRSVLPWAMRPV